MLHLATVLSGLHVDAREDETVILLPRLGKPYVIRKEWIPDAERKKEGVNKRRLNRQSHKKEFTKQSSQKLSGESQNTKQTQKRKRRE